MAQNEVNTNVEAVMSEDHSVFELLAGYTDSEGNLHKEFELTEMTGEDEENIARPEVQSNSGKIITTLLSRCCLRIGEFTRQEMGPKKWEELIKNLFIGDRDYMIFKLRTVTFGSDIEMEPQCPRCGTKFAYLLEEGDIEIRRPKEDLDPHNIPFSIPKGVFHAKSNKFVKEGILRLPVGSDQEALDPIARKNIGQANTSMIARVVKELGDVGLNSMVFRKLSLKDRDAIINTVADHQFGPKLATTVACPSCSGEFEAGVSMADFF